MKGASARALPTELRDAGAGLGAAVRIDGDIGAPGLGVPVAQETRAR